MYAQKVIEQFGYKPNEAKIYLMVLKCGECTISQIAHELKIPRTSVQVTLEKLHIDGLLNFYIKKRSRYWTVENPEKLLVQLQEREKQFQIALPQLQSMMKHHQKQKPIVKIFVGVQELKLIHSDILETKHNIYAIIPFDDWLHLFGEEYINQVHQERAEHFLRLNILVPKTKKSIIFKQKDSIRFCNTKFLSSHIHVEDAVFIYDSKVAIISLQKQQSTGVLIEDSATKNTMKIFFDQLWDTAEL